MCILKMYPDILSGDHDSVCLCLCVGDVSSYGVCLCVEDVSSNDNW